MNVVRNYMGRGAFLCSFFNRKINVHQLHLMGWGGKHDIYKAG